MEGIDRMVRNDVYCIEILNQLRAVQAALDKIGLMLLDNHLRSCVTAAVLGEDRQERIRAITEFLTLFDMSRQFRRSEVNHLVSQKGESDMNTKTFRVPNISCGGCTNTIERKVGQLAGVASVNTERATKHVTVSWEEPASWEQIQTALQEINYPPEGIIKID
jgi:DNA-binding FrmR family transcriptional regulator/copper chaperone CopZ